MDPQGDEFARLLAKNRHFTGNRLRVGAARASPSFLGEGGHLSAPNLRLDCLSWITVLCEREALTQLLWAESERGMVESVRTSA